MELTSVKIQIWRLKYTERSCYYHKIKISPYFSLYVDHAMETLQIRRLSTYVAMRATKTMLSLGLCPIVFSTIVFILLGCRRTDI